MQARVKVRIKKDKRNDEEAAVLVDTTIGRTLVGEILPDAVPFSLVNKEMSKKELRKVYSERGEADHLPE